MFLTLLITFFSSLNFKKDTPPPDKMPETKQQWIQEAQNIPLEDRVLKKEKADIDTKLYHIPDSEYKFEKYNNPPGTREFNIEDIKKNLTYYSYLITDKECHWAAYSHYYYTPETNQISSAFFVEKLDTTKTKQDRILSYNHKQQERKPIIQSGLIENYPDLYRGLTLVDWNSSGTKLLIKEKTGSAYGGIYKTTLYVHFLDRNRTIKLVNLDSAIKDYFLKNENLQIIKYRYDIMPLGFDSENDNAIIVLSYIYDKEGNKIFNGKWSYDCSNDEIKLLSKTSAQASISINGLILKPKIN